MDKDDDDDDPLSPYCSMSPSHLGALLPLSVSPRADAHSRRPEYRLIEGEIKDHSPALRVLS